MACQCGGEMKDVAAHLTWGFDLELTPIGDRNGIASGVLSTQEPAISYYFSVTTYQCVKGVFLYMNCGV